MRAAECLRGAPDARGVLTVANTLHSSQDPTGWSRGEIFGLIRKAEMLRQAPNSSRLRKGTWAGANKRMRAERIGARCERGRPVLDCESRVMLWFNVLPNFLLPSGRCVGQHNRNVVFDDRIEVANGNTGGVLLEWRSAGSQ